MRHVLILATVLGLVFPGCGHEKPSKTPEVTQRYKISAQHGIGVNTWKSDGKVNWNDELIYFYVDDMEVRVSTNALISIEEITR